MAKRKRAWADDPETAARIDWAIRESQKRVESQPWAAVVLAQVSVEVALSFIVNSLTQRQEPALREWIDGLGADRLRRDEDVGLINALLARSGERIDGDAALWSALMRHIERRNRFIHRGERPTVEAARESVTTCVAFHERLLRLANAAGRKLGLLAAARRRALAQTWALERLAQEDGGDAEPEGAE